MLNSYSLEFVNLDNNKERKGSTVRATNFEKASRRAEQEVALDTALSGKRWVLVSIKEVL